MGFELDALYLWGLTRAEGVGDSLVKNNFLIYNLFVLTVVVIFYIPSKILATSLILLYLVEQPCFLVSCLLPSRLTLKLM